MKGTSMNIPRESLLDYVNVTEKEWYLLTATKSFLADQKQLGNSYYTIPNKVALTTTISKNLFHQKQTLETDIISLIDNIISKYVINVHFLDGMSSFNRVFYLASPKPSWITNYQNAHFNNRLSADSIDAVIPRLETLTASKNNFEFINSNNINQNIKDAHVAEFILKEWKSIFNESILKNEDNRYEIVSSEPDQIQVFTQNESNIYLSKYDNSYQIIT